MTDDRLAIDLARLAADDDLLDRIGRGDPVEDAPDPIALLAQWRAALPDRPGTGHAEQAPAAVDDQVPEPAAPYRPHTGTLDPSPSLEPETTAFLEPVHPVAPSPEIVHPKAPRKAAKPRNAGRVVRWLAAAAAVIAAGFGVVTLTGHQTEGPSAPSSPAGPDRIAIAAAERVLGDVRMSIARGDMQNARTLLDRVSTLIDDVGDPAEERRLRAELDRLRALAVEPPPTSTTSTTVTTQQARVLPTTTVLPVTAGGPAKPPQVTTTTPSVRTRPGLPTLLPSVLPTFR
ncbi:hypothetical protein [Actinokineospora sp.]|uniref:hypothetical protein n=1 Tax=Actinokineospora sp. TaxID=1872133 RepID=UPI003D6AB491